jgi:histone demethylase JARID1
MRQEMPDLFRQQPDLLFHITTMLSPKRLRELGVNVTTMHQRWGEFIVTFPESYHAGFNHGVRYTSLIYFLIL